MSQASSTTAQPQATQPAAPPAEAPMTIQQDDVWLPQASSTYAEPHDAAWNFNLWVSIGFFVIVMAPMFYFAVKYKRKSEDERTSPVDHNMKLELFWTLIPTVLLIYMFWIGFKLLRPRAGRAERRDGDQGHRPDVQLDLRVPGRDGHDRAGVSRRTARSS